MPSLNRLCRIEVLSLQWDGEQIVSSPVAATALKLWRRYATVKWITEAKHNTTNRRSRDKTAGLICRTGKAKRKGVSCSVVLEKERKDRYLPRKSIKAYLQLL